jgi:hypothetical protein
MRYAIDGWYVFLVAACGKQPLISVADGGRGFKDATTNIEQVVAWWMRWPNGNIGCWPGPSGLVVIDVDGPAGEAAAQELGLLDQPTLVCRTGRPDGGRHLYFRRPNFHVGNRGLAPQLEVRSDDGYVLVPPSVHPSGAVYRWEGTWDLVAELPPRARDALERAQLEPAAAVAEAPPRLASLPPPNSEALERRIRAYLAKVPRGLAEGEGRNNTGYQLTAFLTHDLARPESVAFQWVAEWNATNRPPLSQRELTRLFRSAVRNGKRSVACGLLPTRTSDVRAAPPVDPFAGVAVSAGDVWGVP